MPDALPHNRKEVFFDCIKQRRDVLIRCGLCLLLAALPLLILHISTGLAYGNLRGSGETESFFAMKQIAALGDIPCLLLLSIGLAGCARVFRQLIWGEPVFFWNHFFTGIKQNAVTFAVVFAGFGLIRFISVTLETLFLSPLVNIPSVINWFLLLPMGLYMLSQSVFYTNSLAKNAVNGFALYFRTAPGVWGFIALLLLWRLTNMIPSLVLFIIMKVVGLIVFLPLLSIAWLLFSCRTFDRFVNPGIYPDLIGKGMYPVNSLVKK